ncbi:MAG: effector binding domain-containing protein [Bacillota bacterium]
MESNTEILLKTVNSDCSIVAKDRINIIGIKTVMTSENINGFLDIAKKHIEGGSLKIIENLYTNQNPGQFIGVIADNQGGGNFTYIVGFEVDGAVDSHMYLPENVIYYQCPGGKFARIRDYSNNGGYELWSYFIGEFRKDTDYVYDKERLSYHMLDGSANVLYAYEPVKTPATEDERYDSIDSKVVILPEMKFAGIKSDIRHGIDIIDKYFTEYEEEINKLSTRKLYIQDYLGFPLYENEITYSCFGAQVQSFDELPEGVDKIILNGGLYILLKQLEMNNDNPTALYNAIDYVFSKKNPQFKLDTDRSEIVRFHQGHSASLYVPVIKA